MRTFMGNIVYLIAAVGLLLHGVVTGDVGWRNADQSRTQRTELVPDAMIEACSRHFQSAALSDLRQSIQDAAKLYRIDEELIVAVIITESGCRVRARSNKGAAGLMQLMPATAKWLGVSDPYAPRENILGGAKYLSYLLDKCEGDLQLALASYNAGPYKVKKFGAVPPYPETRRYVKRVMEHYNRLRTSIAQEA